MTEVAVHFAANGSDADVAASALRAAGLHPRIALDTTFGLASGLTSNSGRRVIYVPAREERDARDVLQEPAYEEEPEDNPILRMIVIVAIIVGLLFATPFVAQVCYPKS